MATLWWLACATTRRLAITTLAQSPRLRTCVLVSFRAFPGCRTSHACVRLGVSHTGTTQCTPLHQWHLPPASSETACHAAPAGAHASRSTRDTLVHAPHRQFGRRRGASWALSMLLNAARAAAVQYLGTAPKSASFARFPPPPITRARARPHSLPACNTRRAPATASCQAWSAHLLRYRHVHLPRMLAGVQDEARSEPPSTCRAPRAVHAVPRLQRRSPGYLPRYPPTLVPRHCPRDTHGQGKSRPRARQGTGQA